MTKCIGLIGKIFGHKFDKILINSNLTGKFDLENCTLDEMKDATDHWRNCEYIVICKRCGAKCNE